MATVKHNVKVKGCFVVKPSSVSKSDRLILSDIDQDKTLSHSLVVFFFDTNPSFSYPSAMESLRTSLSVLLSHFYPAAGRLRYLEDGSGRVELDCNDSGAVLYEAQSDASIHDFGYFCPSPELRALVPSVNYDVPIHEWPLLLVQFTQLKCGRVCLGVSLSHSVADATSFFYMINEWGRISRGELLRKAPIHDRCCLMAANPPVFPKFRHKEYEIQPVLIGKKDHEEERNKETTVAVLQLNETQVNELKNRANEGRDITDFKPYSKYEAVAAHLWKCACKARKLGNQQRTTLKIVVSYRLRIQPPIPREYFGNAFGITMAYSRSGEILTKPLGYAASKAREALEMVNDEYVSSTINFLRKQKDVSKLRPTHTGELQKGPFAGNSSILVNSWVSFLSKEDPIDFGWGKLIHIGPAAIGYDGKFYIISPFDQDETKGSHSQLIYLRLQAAHMEDFKRFFYEDINTNCTIPSKL